jgi:hypothetical protein
MILGTGLCSGRTSALMEAQRANFIGIKPTR